MQATSVQFVMDGVRYWANRKVFRTGSVGYFYTGKVFIEGVKHQCQITLVEVGSKGAKPPGIVSLADQADDVTLLAKDGTEVVVPGGLDVNTQTPSVLDALRARQSPLETKVAPTPTEPAKTPRAKRGKREKASETPPETPPQNPQESA